MDALEITVKGIVQGVGFRPFVYQLAHRYQLKGYVKNSPAGVTIHLEGDSNEIKSFLENLRDEAPSLSKIEQIHTAPAQIEGYERFKILASSNAENASTLLPPDAAVCPECLKDINNLLDTRRYHYAFTNCTNCGPRFSIIKGLPYDRPLTTMQGFKMCPSCQKEYENPLNRRFHAQPTCCKECGPVLSLLDHNGVELAEKDPIPKVRSLIKAGHIIAVKGLGGFHLICDAASPQTIQLLRTRKKRPTKPLALMMKDLGTVLQYCCFDSVEEKILLGSQRPILLLKKKNNLLPYNIAFGHSNLGVMLPYTPLHHMLFDETLTVLVVTSANHSGMPMIFKNEEALEELKDIADYFLVHNRDIHIPIDDSVVQVTLGEQRVIRNARGYAPLCFHHPSSEVLALGSELKNTFCLSKENHCFISPYIGDLSTAETMTHFISNINHFKAMYEASPKVIVYDYHPNFSYKDYVEGHEVKKIGVYHHHAHIASCMAENKIDETVIGIAFDGIGYGDDGTIWGSEFLICNLEEFKRLGHLNYFKMPGGDMSAKQPWRLAVSLLYETFGEDLSDILPSHLADKEILPILSMLKNNIASPMTCSMGRLFDGIAALLGFNDKVSYEAEACIYLENLALSSPNKDNTYAYNPAIDPAYQHEIYDYDIYDYDIVNDSGKWVICYQSIVRHIVKDIKLGLNRTVISRKFHDTLCMITLDLCKRLRRDFSINLVALGGGVFQNKLLLSQTYRLLTNHDFKVLIHQQIPCNDSGLSAGQLAIASKLMRK